MENITIDLDNQQQIPFDTELKSTSPYHNILARNISSVDKKTYGDQVAINNLDLHQTLAPRLKSIGIFKNAKSKREYEYQKVKPTQVFSRDDQYTALSKANERHEIKYDPGSGKMYINELWTGKLYQQIESASKLIELNKYMGVYKKNLATIR